MVLSSSEDIAILEEGELKHTEVQDDEAEANTRLMDLTGAINT